MTPHEKIFKSGEHLFREGDPSHCMYLIRSGSVSVRKTKGSSFVEIAKVFSNEVIGELSFFDRLPRSASAVALSDVDALEISFEALDKIYEKVPDYMKTIIAAVAERLRHTNDLVRRLQQADEPKKTEPSRSEPEST